MKNKKIIIGLCCGVVIIIGIFLVLIATRKPVEKNVRRADHSTKTKTPTAELEILQAIFKMVEIRHMYKDVGW